MDTRLEETLRALVGGLIRTALAGAIGWLSAKGILTEDQSTQLITGLAATLVVFGWSAVQKLTAGRKIAVALALPSGATPEQLNEAASKESLIPEAVKP